MPRKTSGFTLIEVMIVVAIIGILAAIAYPSYAEHMRKTRRADATASLTALAQRLERCYTQNFSYLNCLPASETSEQGFYSITVAAEKTTFSLSAAAVASGPQASDGKCTKFVLTNTGKRTAEGSASGQCWL